MLRVSSGGIGSYGRAAFADGKVEALVGKGQRFGIAVQGFKSEAMFGLQAATSGYLVGRIVDGAASDHPGRDVARAAAVPLR